MGQNGRSVVVRDSWVRRLLRWLTGAYPGDFLGVPEMQYSPVADGRPDPGEVVWTWVPFEDDYRKGKDRPVLLIGRDGRWLLGVMLTTKLRGSSDPRRGRISTRVPIGAGAWDPQRRPSEVRVDRIIRVKPSRIRREGASIDPARFAAVADGVRRHASRHRLLT